MWRNVGLLHQKRPNSVKNRGFVAQCREKNVHKRKASKFASPEDTSWEKRLRKHIVFLDHPRNYIFKFWRIYLPQVKNYIADVYFSELIFEYVKNSLT